MTTAFDFVQRQIDVYTDQSEQSEHWKPDHHEAMACRNLEDAVIFGNALHESIGSRNTKGLVTVSDASVIVDLYARWYKVSLRILRAIETFEELGYTVEGADAFRANIDQVSRCRDQLKRMHKATESLLQGRGISLSEAINAIRGNCRT